MADAEGNQQAQDGNLVYVWKIPLDKSYVKSLDSILKLVTAVLALISFICCASGRTDNCDDSYASTYNYFEFVAMTTFLTILILWFFYTVTLRARLFFKMLDWNLVDMIYCCVFIVLFVIASIVIAAQPCGKDSNKAAAAFGFFTTGVLGANAFFSFRAWRGAPRQSTSENSKSPDYNPDKNMEQY